MRLRVDLILAALFVRATAAALAASAGRDFSDQYFDWEVIKSTKELEYTNCYGPFQCARLEVPLDWSNSSNPNRVSIAIVRLPAVVYVADESFGGTVVINPGGPGGSGIDSILQGGKALQAIVDGDKHFEILSFDPRGMKFSTPSTACFEDDFFRTVIEIHAINVGSLESNPEALNVKWSIDKGLGRLCREASNGKFQDGSNIHQFVSTAAVAQDMVEIIDQVDSHLRKELSSRKGHVHDHQMPIIDPLRQVPLLNYWGLSYGTLLGNTFASMFPNRIGRMVLDGVVDADDYTATGWTSNLQDNNKTWTKFFEYCFEAGPRCPLFDKSTKCPDEIRAKVETFLFQLRNDPIPLLFNGNLIMLTYHQLKLNIHLALYFPNELWPLLATGLRSLLEGDTPGAISVLESDLWRKPSSGSFTPSTPFHSWRWTSRNQHWSASEPYTPGYPWQLEAAVSVLCGDGDDISSRPKTDFEAIAALLESQSPIVGSIWSEIPMYCIHWPASVRPSLKHRFTGPFQSNLTDYDPRGSPLLFIGNTADPVTPLRNALKMSERHEGSVVITQDVPGHCAATVNPSFCTYEVLKQFFSNGTLPKPGLVCEGARKPWDY
ncbi:hypothetical protein LTR99_000941 [Exophiala xenobiotica]|uniref:Peptidase S33 tripeptidyl aminopeptidase-like C-terminal domain-containing protein n=1 Tax=Vermiconidia calcicola TaxID=1690605 RepID=A0AAV9QNC4_9PEZI|nr:hypothetical protein LTR96_003728 [Exophiala xenobiotica]KAK5540715.1 hypothetical protein LTR23_005946 [Chaetothyriales sp. CCFEE 6169]KAK5545504.1 hypothetical protein LTR25_000511 [Vermiconidia calcicola]KAK5307969.1 hypothetical protein LTR99_000941 [Exophiala xenobiotica]KAK5343134.1 hypothetical protein LTR98_000763 [Exophiala xenobiotica]